MSKQIYGWKRFWCPRSGSINLADGGYLSDPEGEWGKAYNPDLVSLEAIATIRAEFPNAAMIMFSIYETDEDIYQELRAGAKAYLLKDTPCPEILEVIRAVSEGQRYVPADIGTKLAARMERPTLSDREFEVLSLMVEGKNNKAIARLIA
jgi:DNA-binding NarL/FixJ family response regulator